MKKFFGQFYFPAENTGKMKKMIFFSFYIGEKMYNVEQKIEKQFSVRVFSSPRVLHRLDGQSRSFILY